MMKVLVTGSSGVVGRWVNETLQQHGHSVVGLDKKPADFDQELLSFHQANILDRGKMLQVFADEKPEGLIHLAARCDLGGKTVEDYEDNRDGVRNVCQAVRECGSVQRAIYTSTQLVCRIGHVPARADEYCPNTPYGESKVFTEKVVHEENGGDAEWVIVRPTTVWGPHMNDHYRGLLRHICRGTFFHSGGGELLKSYAFAGNIAHQFHQLLTEPAEGISSETFYLADYVPLSLRDYSNELARHLGARKIPTVPLPLARLLAWAGDVLNGVGVKRFPYNSFRLKNIRTEYVYDMSKTEAACGPLPYDFAEGVRWTAEWFQTEVLRSQ